MLSPCLTDLQDRKPCLSTRLLHLIAPRSTGFAASERERLSVNACSLFPRQAKLGLPSTPASTESVAFFPEAVGKGRLWSRSLVSSVTRGLGGRRRGEAPRAEVVRENDSREQVLVVTEQKCGGMASGGI